MSISLFYYMEISDANGKWHLVKSYGNNTFNQTSENKESLSDELEEAIEKHGGLAWRDEFTWNHNLRTNALPKDLSEELHDYLEKERLNSLARWQETKSKGDIRGDDRWYQPENFYKKYSYISLDDMYDICEKKMSDWKEQVSKRLKDIKEDDIQKKLDWLIQERQGKNPPPIKTTTIEEEFEDTINYYLDEYLWDVIARYREVWELYILARTYSQDHYLPMSSVRIIYYFE